MTSDTLKNVVVVGAATAGVLIAQTLAKSLPDTHQVVLVEANPVAYWPIAALRAAVQPGFEEKVVHDLTATTIFGEGSRHVVLAGTRVIDLKPDHVVVDRDVSSLLSGSETVSQGKSRIFVDKVALAVGADYGFPARISSDVKTKEDVLNQFRKMQKEIEAAQEILVIGGGPTGVEFVGEVLDQHPNKVVTLLTRGPGLATNGNDAFGGLSNKLLSQIRAKGVRVILNDSFPSTDLHTGPLGSSQSFTTASGETISADYIMLGSGGKPHTAWIASIDTNLVDAETRLIKVSSTFAVTAAGWENYYAVGDAASTPGPKTCMMAKQHAPQVANNILVSISHKPESKLQKAAGPPGNMIVVPLGKTGGAGHLMYFTVGSWFTGLIKGKTLFLSMFEGWFKA